MGITPENAGRAYVFFTLVKEFVGNFNLEGESKPIWGTVLGHGIAHELGHALIPPAIAHSFSGIMRARWTYTEWTQMRAGTLGFDAARAKIMRQTIEQRSRTLDPWTQRR
jgi:hypothetical protein